MTKKTTYDFEEHIITRLEGFSKQFPPLALSFRQGLVSVMPWIALIFGVIGVVTTIGGLGLSTIFLPLVLMDNGLSGTAGTIINLVMSLAGAIFMIVAVPHLRQARYLGWRLLFWSELIGFVSAVLVGSLGGIFFSCVSFYLLFQIKSFYK